MTRTAAILIFLATAALAQQPTPGKIQRGTLVSVDAEKLRVTVKANDKEIVATADEQTRFFEAKGANAKEKLQSFKAGVEVMFVIQPKDGKNYLFGLRLADAGKPGNPLAKFDSSKLLPINELGTKEYRGFMGGFYPDGKNERPARHDALGKALAAQVQPLDGDGKPDAAGKIVMLSVGMSNTSQASQGFAQVLAGAKDKNPALIFVNGAQGGMTAARIQNPDDKASGEKYWAAVEQQLRKTGVSASQVQVVWIKQADAGPSQGFPIYVKTLEAELTRIVRLLPKRFPNLKMVYLSSRTYGGYAKSSLNPEPYAYESAFSVKWLIERQIGGEIELNCDPKKGAVQAPWLAWGPYLWANGMTKRPDGFAYAESDFANDGTHHSPDGSRKIGARMLRFFESDETTRPWFTKK
ncbi:MAG: hypothetical protein EXS16_11030 [Gemmataceae bacterium]|nr:hypothetical protein [Gemmataceae bacterium]